MWTSGENSVGGPPIHPVTANFTSSVLQESPELKSLAGGREVQKNRSVDFGLVLQMSEGSGQQGDFPAQQIGMICDAFEAAWDPHAPPRIEDFLNDVFAKPVPGSRHTVSVAMSDATRRFAASKNVVRIFCIDAQFDGRPVLPCWPASALIRLNAGRHRKWMRNSVAQEAAIVLRDQFPIRIV